MKQFYQIKGVNIEETRLRSKNSLGYYNFLRGIGTIDWYADKLNLPTSVQPRYLIYADKDKIEHTGYVLEEDTIVSNKNYKGEVYIINGEGEIQDYQVEPNKLKILVNMKSTLTIIINQNYDADWVSDAGDVVNHGNLIAVNLKDKGLKWITLTYRPKKFFFCLLFSLICSIFSIYLLRSNKAIRKLVFQ
ncbi:hypothetical protein ACFLUV_04435 [Elusimicrobiota bacterium]